MSTPIDELTIEIDAKAQNANSAIDNLCKKIDVLTTSISKVDVGKLNSLGNGIKRLGDSLQTMKSVDTRSINSVVNKINSLSAIDTSQFATVSANLHQMANGIQSLGTVSANVASVGELAKNISKLGNKSVQTAITNIPQLATALNGLMTTLSKAPKVSQNLIDMTNALANLTAQGSKVGSASNSIVKGLNRASSSATRANKSFKGLASAFGRFYANCFLVIRGVKSLWKSINSTADYLEAFNYFEVALNKVGGDWASRFEQYGYASAEEYANSFKTRLNESLKGLSGVQISIDANGKTGLLTDTGMKNLGLNIQEVTQYASQLASVTNSVGQTGETTLATASAFTKLGADMSSLFNVDYSSVMNNLQSGLIGQSRALYKYGIDITNATLQTYAYKLGVSKAVSEMTQAEKMQLRMIAILDQSRVSWGDQANTINSLSNSIRQFKNNISEAGQILGQLFVPILSKVMPIINGVVIAIKRLMVNVAGLLGIKLDLSEFGQGTSDITDDMDGLGDSLDGIAESAKKAKAGIRGFDELNVISTSSDSGNETSASVGGIDLTDDILKATSEYEKAWKEAYDRMQNRAEAFADKIEKALEPVKKIFKDFAVGDFFQAGQDVSNLVSSINNFIADAIDNVDWEAVGSKIGEFLEGIDWTSVLSSIGDLIWQAINAGIELWKGSFDAAPIETTIITGIMLLKFTGVGGIIAKKIVSSLVEELSLLTIGGNLVSWLSNNIGTASFDVIGSEILSKISEGVKKILPDWAYELLSNIGAGIVLGAATGSWFPGAGTVAGAIIGAIAGALNTIEIDGKKFWKVVEEKLFNFSDTNYLFSITESFFADLSEAFADKDWLRIGKDILLGILSGLATPFVFILEPFKDLFELIWNGICDVFGIHSPAKEMEPLGEYIAKGIVEGFKEIKYYFYSAVNEWFKKYVSPWFSSEKWNFSGIKDGIKKAFENAVNAAKKVWNGFACWINDALNLDFDGFSKKIKVLGKEINIGIPAFNVQLGKLPTFQTGGFPEDGLFMANHSELVGKFSNGKTAVANNEQITKGIEEAAYRGMLRALSQSSSGNQEVNVYLKGDAAGVFELVRSENNKVRKATGRNVFA